MLPLSLDRPLWTDNLLAKQRHAAYGGAAGPGGSPIGLRMQMSGSQPHIDNSKKRGSYSGTHP